MSMVMELISAIAASQREMDQQMAQLTAYIQKLDEVLHMTHSIFEGSRSQAYRDLVDRITKTKERVQTAVTALRVAKEKLSRVSMI